MELAVTVDGAFFTGGFAVAVRRMQNVVFGLGPTRIEGSPGQKFPGPMTKPANELRTILRLPRKALRGLRYGESERIHQTD